MIEQYSFGRIVIDGCEYTSDIIIFPEGRVKDTWWRKNGHQLLAVDIEELIDASPDIIVAGTGANGLMEPEPGLETTLSARGIAFESFPSAKAVNAYNRLCGAKKIGACFHLAC